MFGNPYPRFEKHPLEEFDDRAQALSDLAREFKYTKAGIWDVFEQIPVSKFSVNIPGMSKLSRQFEFVGDLPFVWRMVGDVIKINSCWYYLSLFTMAKFLAALEPAVALWCVVLRVIRFSRDSYLQRSGSTVITLPSCVSARPLLVFPDRAPRSKWLWMNGA